jgi:DNA processing protein
MEETESKSGISKNSLAIPITANDHDFPDCLNSIPHPPSILFYRGDISLVKFSQRITIVGTRMPTDSGIEECQYITKWFVDREYVIVSGLAKGIDTVAHETCLKYGGKTIAILPSGIGNIYPPENKVLSERIVESGGLLLSEYPPDSSAQKSYFIKRNRIQSGLSSGIVVVESEISGGTMHTANFAIKQNRHLGCVVFSDDLENQSIRSGNRLLLSRGKAFGLTRETIMDFEMMLKND